MALVPTQEVREYDLRVISLGAGVQSTTMYLLACHGEIKPLPNAAIFADTQQEPPWVYENLERLRKQWGSTIPIIIATAGNLGDAVRAGINSTGGRFASVPFWVRGADGREAPGRRQCTREYKIDVVKREIRNQLGLRPRQRAAGRFLVEEWVGISTDEATRAKPSRYPWIVTRWPLLFDRPMNREDCKRWLVEHNYPIPGKSACVFCPYRGVPEWLRWKREHPVEFETACAWDEAIRSKGTMKDVAGSQYVLRTLRPLREVGVEDLPKKYRAQDEFENECEGMCGV